MRILAVDQARHGGWSVFDYETKSLVDYGEFNFDSRKFSFEECLVCVSEFVATLMDQFMCDAVFIEDTQFQSNVLVLKQLARLQGALMLTFKKHGWLFDVVTPSQWQSFCKASGRTQKEIKAKVTSSESGQKRRSKMLSMEFVKNQYGVDTTNDNVADAISIGHYVVHKIELNVLDEKEK